MLLSKQRVQGSKDAVSRWWPPKCAIWRSVARRQRRKSRLSLAIRSIKWRSVVNWLEAGRTMDEVVASVRHVTEIMGEITAASQEQSTGIEQVNQAIAQMDEVTQQNAALVEEAAAAAAGLQDQASNLSHVVSVFRLDDTHTTAVMMTATSLGSAHGRSRPKTAPDISYTLKLK